ncbi:DUF4190 domain-containing protein [Nocardioides bruguierae]|uniref:DUF4190 domain-containing protein n=1 Tax=Nocardioides bruguierae TaxID=2945102 RepID=A0A9X2IG21_9ACTN|nr:DUF4190 domain-containing protein [Nocardioides bruguierae]MCM0621578.1 DUF4190 domain-containing protein [Nocardioides bruguierae]
MSYDAPPPPPPYGGEPGGYAAPAGKSKKAIWALVTGIVGLLCCGPAAIVAIVLGHQAKGEISASGQEGAGMAQAGFILGIVGVVLWVLILILNAGSFMSV